MNYNKVKVGAVKDFIMRLDDADIFSIYRDFADDYDESPIFENNDETLNEIFDKHSDAVRAAIYGDYSYSHDYVMLDGNGNLESSDSLCHLIDSDELTDWVIENNPREIHDNLEETLRDEFSELFAAEHPNADIEDKLYNYDIIGDDWNDLVAEIEAELESDSDDE